MPAAYVALRSRSNQELTLRLVNRGLEHEEPAFELPLQRRALATGEERGAFGGRRAARAGRIARCACRDRRRLRDVRPQARARQERVLQALPRDRLQLAI